MDRPDSTQGDRHDTLLFVRRAAGGDGDGVTHRRSGRIPLTLVLVVTLLYLSMRGWPQTSARDPHDAGTSGRRHSIGRCRMTRPDVVDVAAAHSSFDPFGRPSTHRSHVAHPGLSVFDGVRPSGLVPL